MKLQNMKKKRGTKEITGEGQIKNLEQKRILRDSVPISTIPPSFPGSL